MNSYKDGSKNCVQCNFPFWYGGVKYEKDCVRWGRSDKFWCAITKNNETNEYTSGPDDFGLCSDEVDVDCKLKLGKLKVL